MFRLLQRQRLRKRSRRSSPQGASKGALTPDRSSTVSAKHHMMSQGGNMLFDSHLVYQIVVWFKKVSFVFSYLKDTICTDYIKRLFNSRSTSSGNWKACCKDMKLNCHNLKTISYNLTFLLFGIFCIKCFVVYLGIGCRHG